MKSRSHKNTHSKFSRRNKKGGFFPSNNYEPIASSDECDPNNLSMIKGSQDLQANYQKCCPKGIDGTTNSSPYCKQVDLNLQVEIKPENNANEYQGVQPEQAQPPAAPAKSWYNFWGGKKTRGKRRRGKKTRRNKKGSRRHRK
jgi:hypothetical protein